MVAIVQFTVTDLAARVSAMPGHDGYTIRNAAYDLRKFRGKNLAGKPSRTSQYLISPGTARIISALLTLRDQVTAPLLAGVADPSCAENLIRPGGRNYSVSAAV